LITGETGAGKTMLARYIKKVRDDTLAAANRDESGAAWGGLTQAYRKPVLHQSN